MEEGHTPTPTPTPTPDPNPNFNPTPTPNPSPNPTPTPHPTPHQVIEASCVAGTGLKAMDKPHVLVVEDTTMCADVLRVMLKQLGCSSDHAEHGEQVRP